MTVPWRAGAGDDERRTGLRRTIAGVRAHPHEARSALDTLLTILEKFIRTFVVVTAEQATAIVLWTASTHTLNAFDCLAFLQITSAVKGSGKTRLLEVLEQVVARPWLTGRVTAAVLVRKTDRECPTLLLDESDAAFKGEKEYAEALRGILNTGYRRSGTVSLCMCQSVNITYRDFRTFGPKAIAGIGSLPATIADRCIRIVLQKRRKDERCARWREREGREQAAPVRTALANWAEQKPTVERLREVRPDLPETLSDRAQDIWEPLLAIADEAGGQWPEAARLAAKALAGSLDDEDILIELLTDLAPVVKSAVERETKIIPSLTIIAALVTDDSRPWKTWGKQEKGITPHSLARLLKPLGLKPVHSEQGNGYSCEALNDAILRYLPSKASESSEANKTGAKTPEPAAQDTAAPNPQVQADQARKHWSAEGLKDRMAGTGERPRREGDEASDVGHF
jgi:hypothetical protein